MSNFLGITYKKWYDIAEGIIRSKEGLGKYLNFEKFKPPIQADFRGDIAKWKEKVEQWKNGKLRVFQIFCDGILYGSYAHTITEPFRKKDTSGEKLNAMLALLMTTFRGYTISGFMKEIQDVVDVEWRKHKGDDLLKFIEEQYRLNEDLKEF